MELPDTLTARVGFVMQLALLRVQRSGEAALAELSLRGHEYGLLALLENGPVARQHEVLDGGLHGRRLEGPRARADAPGPAQEPGVGEAASAFLVASHDNSLAPTTTSVVHSQPLHLS